MGPVLRVCAGVHRWLATRVYLIRPAVVRRVVYARAAVALARRLGDPGPLGRSLAVLCRTLLSAGRPAEALGPGKEAVDLLRGRERTDVAIFYAQALRSCGRPADALTVVEEAAATYRALLDGAARGRHLLHLHLGFVLAEYGQCLAGLDRHTEAVTVLREALDCLDELVLSRVVRTVFQRVAARQVLTRSLLVVGASDEAVAVAAGTLEWSGLVARYQPSAGRQAHATALGWLAQAPMSAGDYDASLETAQQAVTAYRALGGTAGEREVGLAWVLQLQAGSSEKVGDTDDARVALGEAVDIFARLAGGDDAHRAEHAAVLGARCDLLVRQGRAEEARNATVAAAPRLRTYPPNAVVRTLLRNAGAALNRAGRTEEARRFIDDAIRLAVSSGDRAELVAGQILLARNLERSADLHGAIAALDDAVAALPSRAPADSVPADDTDVLVLGYRAELLEKVGNLDAAEAAAREAVAVGRAIEGSDHLGMVLSRLAQILRRQHHHDEAARLGAEHAQMRRAEVARDPTMAPLLLASLRLRAQDLVAIRRHEEAILDVEEALEVSRQLRERDAGPGTDELARSLRVAGRAYAAADNLDRAVAALRALRDLARHHSTGLRADLAREAFADALREAPQTLPGAWETVTNEPYPGVNTRL